MAVADKSENESSDDETECECDEKNNDKEATADLHKKKSSMYPAILSDKYVMDQEVFQKFFSFAAIEGVCSRLVFS